MPDQFWTNLPALVSAGAAIVSAIFAVAIWLVYRGQWHTMREQAQYMRDGLTETRKTADAARDSAEVAKAALALTQTSVVLLDGIVIEPKGKLSPTTTLKVVLKNNSGAVATEVKSRTVLSVAPDRILQDKTSLPLTLGAGGRMASHLGPLQDILSQPQIDQVLNGELRFVAVIEASYSDANTTTKRSFGSTYNPKTGRFHSMEFQPARVAELIHRLIGKQDQPKQQGQPSEQ